MMVFWEWYCSLFKTKGSEKIDPYLWRCRCGYTWRFNKVQLLRMFLFKDYIHTCPRCQFKSRYRMITHVVREIDTEKIKENNRLLEDK